MLTPGAFGSTEAPSVGDASVFPFSGLPMIFAVFWLWLPVSCVHLVLIRMVSLLWLLVV